VDILTPDITAGRGVVHLTTNFVVDTPLRAQHQQVRASRGENCTVYSNTSGVDSGLDLPGFEADVAARGGGAPAAAAAAPAAAPAAVASAGNMPRCGWGGGGVCLHLWAMFAAAVMTIFGLTP
jgi:hypothetical protein